VLQRLVGPYSFLDSNEAHTTIVEQVKAPADQDGESEANKPAKEAVPGTDTESVDGSTVDITTVAKVVTLPPPSVEEAFAPTIAGLEEARFKCRYMMNRIIQEVRNAC
jgi:hypothetical protein